MPLKNGLPSLSWLYRTKNIVLQEILQKGAQALIEPDSDFAKDASRQVTLHQYLSAIEKMIEAMASLRDFQKEPFTSKEQKELHAMWLLERERETTAVQL